MTVSPSTKNDLVACGVSEGAITVIHNGLTLPKKLKKYSKENVKTVMFLGAHAEDKGIKDAIQVFAALNKDTKNKWQFWDVGCSVPIQIEEFTAYAKTLGVTKNLTFWGYVSEEKKFELLAKTHVLLNPSVHEGWGLVNIEANAAGTPVIAYDVHGSRDSILQNKTGILVPRKDIKAMSEKIIELLENKKKYQAMQKEALRWSKEFTWEKATKESLQYLSKIKI